MAEPLKNLISKEFIQHVADTSAEVINNFSPSFFIKDVINTQWELLELKQRFKHISKSLHKQLSGDYKKDIKTIVLLGNIFHNKVKKDDNFLYLFLPDYIEQFGIEYPSESLDAMETLTILSTCEFAVRPFLIRYKEQVLTKMLLWSKHTHPSVRRFSSEGCRPRLPWGLAIPELKKDPSHIFPILENLKNDESLFVRKSVANNLNDITKDHPLMVMNIAKKWHGNSNNTDWILKHGCRTLLKKGNAETLKIFGISNTIKVEVIELLLQKEKIKIGDELHFSFQLKHNEKEKKKLRIEYIIDYVKATGKSTRKLFKITENTYDTNKIITFKRKQSFKNMTTRKHYTGIHKITIVVNGKECIYKKFEVF